MDSPQYDIMVENGAIGFWSFKPYYKWIVLNTSSS